MADINPFQEVLVHTQYATTFNLREANTNAAYALTRRHVCFGPEEKEQHILAPLILLLGGGLLQLLYISQLL